MSAANASSGEKAKWREERLNPMKSQFNLPPPLYDFFTRSALRSSATLTLPIFVPMVGLRLSSRTPNPDHKGTNTIGREVREEIG